MALGGPASEAVADLVDATAAAAVAVESTAPVAVPAAGVPAVESAPTIPDAGAAARQSGVPLLYFFSPDWRPPDLGTLAAALEKALAAGGVPISFQGFTRYEDFERQLTDSPPEFVIAPAWLVDGASPNPGLTLTVLAHPVHRGRSTYRKALMTRPGIDSIDDLVISALR